MNDGSCWDSDAFPAVSARYNGCTREAYFSVGLQGIAEKDVQTVRDIIDRTIGEVIECVRPLW